MKNLEINYRKMLILCLVLVTALAQGVSSSKAERPLLVGAYTDADLSSENRTLDSFVSDLVSYNNQVGAASKKARLTRLEFDALQKRSDAIKGRVSGVQNALREIIRKLKAAGQWENLDTVLLAKIPDTKFQDFVRREGFKKTLEDTANGISSNASEISNPLEALRPKVSADGRGSIREGRLASLAVRVAYEPAAPAMFALTLKCRLANLRVGVSGFAHGRPTKEAFDNALCACDGLGCAAT